MTKEHICEGVVLHCIDFRFRKILNDYLSSRFPNGYDLISVAGGVKPLLADNGENNFVLEQFKVSNRLHRPEKIILIQHEDCGAYGGSATFGDFDAEQNFQKAELEKAEEFLKRHFSRQNIEKYLFCLSGEIIAL